MRTIWAIFLSMIFSCLLAQECTYSTFYDYRQKAMDYESAGDVAKAIHFYGLELACLAEISGRNAKYAEELTIMGWVIQQSGTYNEALDSLNAALEIFRSLGQEDSYSGAYAYLCLAKTYNVADALYFYKARRYADTAILKYSAIKGPNSKEVSYGYRAIGEAFYLNTNYDSSLHYYLKARETLLKGGHQSSRIYSINEQDIATISIASGTFSESLLKVYKDELASLNPDVDRDDWHTLVANLTEAYMKNEQFDSASKYLGLYQKSLEFKLREALLLDYETYLEFKTRADGKVSYFYKLLMMSQSNQGEVADLVFSHSVFEKTVLLSSYLNRDEEIRRSEAFEAVSFLKEYYAKHYVKSSYRVAVDLDSLKSAISDYELILFMNRTIEEEEVSWNNSRSQLKNGDWIIEYIQGKVAEDSMRYGVLIGNAKSEHLQFIDLCSEEELIAAFANSGSSTLAHLSRGVEVDDMSLIESASVYELIFKPVEPYLKSGDKLYLSAVGELNALSFAALPLADGKYLCQEYELAQVFSTADLSASELDKYQIQLFGGINYEARRPMELKESEKERTVPWSYLAGTAIEIESIAAQADKNNIPWRQYTGLEATEEKFKSLHASSRQSILHVATHGFYFKHPYETHFEKRKNNNTFIEFEMDPMLRNGLIMSGANEAWSGRYSDYYQDGILTAYEIANLDLSHVQLAILSACETGVGDINNSQGVFGLQRGLKMAGVEYVITSLWAVPDKSTAEFMSLFYQYLFKYKDVRKAFIKTQRQMAETYEDSYDWAAWVLIH